MSSDFRLFQGTPWDFEPIPGRDFQPREFAPPQPVAQEDPYAPPKYKTVPPPSGLEGYSRGVLGLVGRHKAAKRQAVVEENETIEKRYRDRIESEKFKIYRATQGKKDYDDIDVEEPDGTYIYFVNKNDPTDRIKIGKAPRKEFAPDRSRNEADMSPAEHEAYLERKARIGAKYDKPSPGRAPSSMELLYSYSNSPDTSKRAFADRLISQKDPALRVRANAAIQMAREAATEINPLKSWKPIFNVEKFQRELERLLDEDGSPAGHATSPSASPPQPAAPERRGRRMRVKTRDGRVLSGTIDAEGNFIPESAGQR